MPVLSLLGRSGEPAEVEGVGPIDIETARMLAADALSFVRVLTHPETGAVLSVGRDRYRIPEDLRRAMRVRDVTCRFSGCRRGGCPRRSRPPEAAATPTSHRSRLRARARRGRTRWDSALSTPARSSA